MTLNGVTHLRLNFLQTHQTSPTAMCQISWMYGTFSAIHVAHTIVWKELYALVVACATWGGRLTGRKVTVNCNNMNIFSAVNKGTIKSPVIMTLIRELFRSSKI